MAFWKTSKENEFKALKNRGIHAILSGECSARITNFAHYGMSAINPKINDIWGHILETNNYGKPTKTTPLNEFSDTRLLNKLADHLDEQLLNWHKLDGWHKDLWDNLEQEYRNKLNLWN